MKTKYILTVLSVGVMILSGCTKQNVNDTGVSSPYFDGSMMEYLRSRPSDWELTVDMIEHAGLTDMFDGKDPEYKEITFFAPTTLSVLRYVWDQDKESVSELSQEFCREMILRHVVKGKYLKDDIAVRDKSYTGQDPQQTGCNDFICVSGNRIRAWRDLSDFGGVPDAGPSALQLYSFDAMRKVPMASPDIQPNNGVVHALNYTYILGKI